MVLVLTKSLEVAAWARRAVRLGPGNDTFRVHVVGPAEMPTIDDPVTAVEQNSLAVLALMTHGNARGNRQAALTAVRALLQRVDIRDAEIYIQLILDIVERDIQEAIERMLSERFPDMKLHPALQKLLDRGKAEGKAEGEAEGEAKGERKALYMILSRRGIDLTAEQRATLDSCSDSAQLEQWINRAFTAASAADLFE
jgi:predicted transposase YdaD